MVPEVSVVIPTYNRAAMVKAAVESVLAQKGVDFELIVVDDGSTDDTEARLSRLHAPLRYLRQPRSGVRVIRIDVKGENFPRSFRSHFLNQHLGDDLGLQICGGVPAHEKKEG